MSAFRLRCLRLVLTLALGCSCSSRDTAPVASIVGVPANPRVAEPISLTAQASVAVGQTATDAWTLTQVPAGSAATLASAAGAATTLTPDLAGTYLVQLVVTDASGDASQPATASIDVPYSSPIFSGITATPSTVLPGGQTTVTCVASSSDGYQVVYTWSLPAGWTTPTSATGSSVTLFAPALPDQQGIVAVTVADGHGATSTASVIVATSSGAAPSASIVAAPAAPRVGTPVTLTAELSLTSGITPAWMLDSTPSGSAVTLSGTSTLVSSFTPDIAGTYVVSFVATDEAGEQSPPVLASVVALPLVAPTLTSLTATPPEVAPGGVLTVNALATSNDGYAVHYTWTFPAGWAPSGVTDGNAVALTAPLLSGVTAQVVVAADDGHGASTTASVAIATSAIAQPVASITATPAQTVVGASVALVGQVAQATGTPSYAWTLALVPAGSTAKLSSSTAATVSFVPDVAGEYVVQLITTDEGVSSVPALATISASPPSAPNLVAVSAAPPTVPPGGNVTISAYATSTDGFPLQYSWTSPAGWTVASGAASNVLTLRAPALLGQSGVVSVVVSDGHGATASGNAAVATSMDTSPTATVTAAPAELVVGNIAMLAAQVSTLDDQPATCAWTLTAAPSGSLAALSQTSGPTVTLVPDLPGAYVVQVIATDASGATSLPALATVSALPYAAPTITSLTASPPSVPPGGTIALTSIAASNDGYPVSYAWNIPTGWTPSGSVTSNALVLTAPLRSSTAAVVTLTASDGHGAAATASIPVATGSDAAPVALITVSPNYPEVGLLTTLTAQVSTANGLSATEAWSLVSVPPESTATLSTTTGRVTSFVPDLAGDYEVQLIATDAAGLSSAPVTTTVSAVYAYSFYLTTAPENPFVGTTVTAMPWTTSPSPGSFVFDWSLTLVPVGSRATIASTSGAVGTFVPDVAGEYEVTLNAADSHGTQAAPTFASVQVTGLLPLTVTLAGGTEMSGYAKVPLGLNELQHYSDSVSYGWSVASAPPGSSCTGSSACISPIVGSSAALFTADVTGNYSVQLVVTDEMTGATGEALQTLIITAPPVMSIVSGNGQSGVVHKQFAQPLVVQVVGANGLPQTAGAPTWQATNGTIVESTPLNTSGQSSALVQASRMASPVTVTATLGAATATFSLSSVPDVPASLALQIAQGTTDAPLIFTVTEVDQFGNATTNDTDANSASVMLTAQSPSGNAAFSPTASTGSIAVTAGKPSQAVATLSEGVFAGQLSDTTAETVHVTLSQAPTGAPLPFTAWTTVFFDGAENGLTDWTALAVTPAWGIESSVVADGTHAFGVSFNAAELALAGTTSLTSTVALTEPAGTSMSELSMDSYVQVSAPFDAYGGCTVQPAFEVSPSDFYGSPPPSPLGGWPVPNACNSGVSFAGTPSWTHVLVDWTDYLPGGLAYAGGQVYVRVSANEEPDTFVGPAASASWYVDDVEVLQLGSPSFSGATTSVHVAPGRAAALQFWQAPNGTVALGQCLTGQAPYTAIVQAVDQNRNLTTASPIVQVTWSGTANTLTLVAQQGTILEVLPQAVQIQLSQGQAQFEVADPSPDTLTFTLNALASGLSVTTPTEKVPVSTWYCHSMESGKWSDGVPSATYTAAEALIACEIVAGNGNCAVNGYYAYATNVTSCQPGWEWTYNTLTIQSPAMCGEPGTLTPGMEVQLYAYTGVTTCPCTPSVGQTSNILWDDEIFQWE